MKYCWLLAKFNGDWLQGTCDDKHSEDNLQKSVSKSLESFLPVGSDNIDRIQFSPTVNFHINDVPSNPTVEQSIQYSPVVLRNWNTSSKNSDSTV